MQHNIKILPEVLRFRVNPGNSYVAFQSGSPAANSPLTNPVRIIKFTNDTDLDLLISWDGTTDHDFIPANSFMLIDVASNKELSSSLYIAAQTQFYVKTVTGTASGTIYLSCYYA